MKLRQRHTAFSKEEQIELGDTTICRMRGNVQRKCITLSQIKSIQLIAEGTTPAHQKPVYRCRLRATGGTPSMFFSNALYGGKDNQAMDREYRQLIEALHDRLKSRWDEIQFVQGSNLVFAAGWFCLIIGLLTALLFILLVVFEVGQAGRIPWSMALIPMVVSGFAIPAIRRGRPKQYDPGLLPDEYLPAA